LLLFSHELPLQVTGYFSWQWYDKTARREQVKNGSATYRHAIDVDIMQHSHNQGAPFMQGVHA
jgi:predicted negative regulator of RcsB-dependent stress response